MKAGPARVVLAAGHEPSTPTIHNTMGLGCPERRPAGQPQGMKLIRLALALALTVLVSSVTAVSAAADEPLESLSAVAYLEQHPGGFLVDDHEVVYPDGSGFVSVDVGVYSISQCASNRFCMWTSTNYSGSFTYVTGSGVTKTLTGTVKSFWNNRTKAARLYSTSGTSSTCYGAGVQKASLPVSYHSPAKVYLSSGTSC